MAAVMEVKSTGAVGVVRMAGEAVALATTLALETTALDPALGSAPTTLEATETTLG